jgi:single-strand DNA-binding protein
MDLNRVQIMGRIGKDPETRSFANGGQVLSMTVATSERWKDKSSGERKERTQWHNVQIFAEPAIKLVSEHCRKGDQILIEGALETRKYQDRDGNDRYVTEVVVRPYTGNVYLIGGAKKPADDGPAQRSLDAERPAASKPAQRKPDYDDEIPFAWALVPWIGAMVAVGSMVA